jgi:hypothetical protein
MRFNSFSRGIIIVFFLFALFSCISFAGPDTRTVQVTGISSNQSWSDLQLKLFESIKTRLKSNGVPVSDKGSDWVLLVDVVSIEQLNGEFIVVSVIVLQSLPKEVVELSKKAEVFYSNLSDEKRAQLPKEGKWLREMVTEEYVGQFSTPLSKDLLVIPKADLEKTAFKIVDNFCSTYLKK